MSEPEPPPVPNVTLTTEQVFPGSGKPEVTFFDSEDWRHPVSYFVGRNGSGKSRTAKLIAKPAGGRLLATDRLAGLTIYNNLGWTSVPILESLRGIPLGDNERAQAKDIPRQSGSGIDEMYAVKDKPEVWLRVAAFLRRALGRVIELRESAGLLDPYVQVGGIEYSLLRDEGHGLRELLILLTAVYREDWSLLVVDEPELHLHPSMSRLWLSELERVCRSNNRRAIVITHEPTLVKPATAEDLEALWLFSPGFPSRTLASTIKPRTEHRVTASLRGNPQLVGQLVFSPRPVLVEGIHDVAALTVALRRTQPSEVVAQTDLIECGGSGGVALWFEIAKSAGLDVRAIADLDALLAPEVQRVMDATPDVVVRYRTDLAAEPAKTSEVLRPLLNEMRAAGVQADPKSHAGWLAGDVPTETGWESRRDKLEEIWRDAGLWLHSEGTLEDVLGIPVDAKGREPAQTAAETPGPIDAVASWCAYSVDPLGDVEHLLGVAVERIAHGIMEALRTEPTTEITAPVGGSASSDARLVQVVPTGGGAYRLVVLKPAEFAGYSLEFSPDTKSSDLILRRPTPNSDS